MDNETNRLNLVKEDLIVVQSIVDMIKSGDLTLEQKNVLSKSLGIVMDMNDTITKLKMDNTVNGLSDNFAHRSIESVDDKVTYIERIQQYLSKGELNEIYYRERTEDDRKILEQAIAKYIKENGMKLNGLSIDDTIQEMIKSILGWDILDEEMDESNVDIEEIQIQDFNDIHVIGKKNGKSGQRIRLPQQFSSPEHLALFADRLVTQAAKHQNAVSNVSDKNPFVRVRLGKYTRVSIMGGGIARRTPGYFEGPCIHICIRKQKPKPFTVQDLIDWGSVSPYGALYLKRAVRCGVSICAFGGTNTGKTSSLRAFFEFIDKDTRIITVAETDEMNLRTLDEREFIADPDDPTKKIKNPEYLKGINTVSMWEAANMEQEIIPGKKGFVALINATLTFTPEFLILQESKGGEIKEVMESSVTGCQTATTIHVNESKYVPMRIVLMYQQSGANIGEKTILDQVPAAFPLLINFKKYKDNSRKLAEIAELLGYDDKMQPIIRPITQYKVISNKLDNNGNLIIKGKHIAIFDPTRGRTFDIMKDNGLLDEEAKELHQAYIDCRIGATEYEQMVAKYNLPEDSYSATKVFNNTLEEA